MKRTLSRPFPAFIAAGFAAALLSPVPPDARAEETPAKPTAAAKPPAAPSKSIVLHSGVPGLVYLGQPIAEFMAKFPGAVSTPFAGQADVVRLQVADQGISVLAMGVSPATMTVESIGFNWQGQYEGVKAGTRRTSEGIGPGSTVNELLEAYGKPADIAQETRKGALAPNQPPGPDATLRYLYRSSDATAATFFIVKGSSVMRMATSRPASVERYILKKAPAVSGGPKPGAAPAAPATPPAKPPR
ncbi:MAG TPA: hypothetical protein VJV75_01290 [Candidatus Polarisedimenticolia bacterium]|nr:hypothetical protein [Candidatus Polarisedimenticolia bacterium]